MKDGTTKHLYTIKARFDDIVHSLKKFEVEQGKPVRAHWTTTEGSELVFKEKRLAESALEFVQEPTAKIYKRS